MLQALGYHGINELTPAARLALSQLSSSIELAKRDATSTRLTLRWNKGPSRLGKLALTPADCTHWALPRGLWPLYLFARPARLIHERVFGRDTPNRKGLVQGHVNLGTPDGLLPPLITFADLTATDHVADIGAGDGRLLFAACRQSGCSALGVEPNPYLGQLARAQAAHDGLSDRVKWITADAQSCDLSEVTLAFFFQPPQVLGHLLPSVCRKLTPETRVISHEQIGLPADLPPPAMSQLIAVSNGLTVAHASTARAFRQGQDR